MKCIDKILFSYRWHSDNTASQRKKMIDMTNKTLKYERKILKNINKKYILNNIKTYLENGYLYKTFGVPFIFQIKKYKKDNIKISELLLFNVKIMSFKRNF